MTPNKLTPIWASMLLASASQIALAEDAISRQDTIIVSGAGPNRVASELVSNASALDRSDILDTLGGTLGETLDSQPGVATSHFGAGASRPILRGLGAERVLVLNNGLGTVDVSAASPDHQVAADGIDAEAIEILRGPAALAYGGQAIGGVINVIDGLIVEEKPEKAFSGGLYSAYNSVNEGSEVAANAKFAVGDFVFSLSGSMRDYDNYDIPSFAESDRLRASEAHEEDEHHDDEDDHDEEHEDGHEDEHDEHEEEIRDTLENSYLKTDTLSGGVSWVGETAFFGAAVRHTTSEYGIPGHSHAHGDEDEHHDDEEDEDHDEHEDEDDHEEDEHGEEEMPFIDLEQTRFDLRGGLNFGETGFTKLIVSASYSDYEHLEFEGPDEVGVKFTNEGTEARVELGHAFGDLKGSWGLQYLDKELAADGAEAFITPTSTQSFGLFAYELREWDDIIAIEGGARFEKIELENDVQGKRDFDLFNVSFGAHKHLGENWFVGAQVGYSERAPNESELFANGPHLATSQYEIGDATLDKESVVNFEGAVRWRTDQTRIGLNLFVNQFSDFIYLTPTTALEGGEIVDELDELPIVGFAQEDADFWGGEFIIEHSISDSLLNADWNASTSLEYVRAKLDNGQDVPLIPPLTMNVGLEADWGKFFAGTDVTIAGAQTRSGEGFLDTSGYTKLDFKTGLRLSEFGLPVENAEIFFDIRNVTDEEIRHATSVLKDTVPARGRNYRFGLRIAL